MIDTIKIWPIVIMMYILLIASCRAKKEAFTSETKVIDSIIIKSEVIKAPVLNDLLVIEQLCDSTTDKPVQFRKIYVIDGDSIEVLTNEKNQLVFKLNQKDKVISNKDSTIRKLETELRESSEKVIVKRDLKSNVIWFVIGMITCAALWIFKPWKPLLAKVRSLNLP